MSTLTVKLPAALAAQLNTLVRRRKQKKSVLVREAIERLVADGNRPAKGSFLDLAGDLAGIYEGGPSDLSSNPKYMRGYGQK